MRYAYSVRTDEEETKKRGPVGKCLNKRKHLCEEEHEGECPELKKKLVSGVLSGTMERQNNPAKEMTGKSGWDDKDYSDELDEYILDMSNEMDVFNILDKTEIEQRKEVKDTLGHALFEPSDVRHPRSAEWWPMRHAAEYIRQKIRKPLERNERNVMRAECSRPVIGEKDSMTPNLDPDLITFLFKLGRDPRKGLERSLK
ncbi:hypothetical protein NDU88_002435 [Pleurodeles waltl]|uniref:Uncharacterized protein n=1 Tax=Pleurodeles waltl TaxID=8319 RepID=A0AAV7MAZ8_PLEWA|nr:hypothetical protein NDU88_002435 [Pleurodeles waltl]